MKVKSNLFCTNPSEWLMVFTDISEAEFNEIISWKDEYAPTSFICAKENVSVTLLITDENEHTLSLLKWKP